MRKIPAGRHDLPRFCRCSLHPQRALDINLNENNKMKGGTQFAEVKMQGKAGPAAESAGRYKKQHGTGKMPDRRAVKTMKNTGDMLASNPQPGVQIRAESRLVAVGATGLGLFKDRSGIVE